MKYLRRNTKIPNKDPHARFIHKCVTLDEERIHGHDDAWGIVATLDGVGDMQSGLYRVGTVWSAHPLHSGDVDPVGRAQGQGAGADRPVVKHPPGA